MREGICACWVAEGVRFDEPGARGRADGPLDMRPLAGIDDGGDARAARHPELTPMERVEQDLAAFLLIFPEFILLLFPLVHMTLRRSLTRQWVLLLAYLILAMLDMYK